MKIAEVVVKKPLTPDQARIRSLQVASDNARAAVQRERDRQRKQREQEKMQRA